MALQQIHQALIGIADGQPFHAFTHGWEQGRVSFVIPQPVTKQPPNRLLKDCCLWFVLMNDHCPALLSGTGGVGLLMLISRLGERHKDRGGPAHRQFT